MRPPTWGGGEPRRGETHRGKTHSTPCTLAPVRNVQQQLAHVQVLGMPRSAPLCSMQMHACEKRAAALAAGQQASHQNNVSWVPPAHEGHIGSSRAIAEENPLQTRRVQGLEGGEQRRQVARRGTVY